MNAIVFLLIKKSIIQDRPKKSREIEVDLLMNVDVPGIIAQEQSR
jgi:hypothetical protein